MSVCDLHRALREGKLTPADAQLVFQTMRQDGPPGGMAQAYRAAISFLRGFAPDVGLSRMTGADSISFAAKLAATYTEAASCRSAISRAYYGAFHLAKKQVESVGYARTSVERAKRIQNALEACDHDSAALDQIKTGVAEYERKIAGA